MALLLPIHHQPQDHPLLRTLRRRRRSRHLHPNSPRPSSRLPHRSQHHSYLHRPLQHRHRPPLWRPHAGPTHEIHCRRRNRRVHPPHRPSNRRRRPFHRRRSPLPRRHRPHVFPLPIYSSSRRPRSPASQGLSFAFSAIKYIRYDQDLTTSKSGTPRPWLGFDGLIVALSAVLFLILSTGAGDNIDRVEIDYCYESSSSIARSRRRIRKRLRVLSAIPAALLVFLFGLLLCFLRDPSILNDLKFGPSKIQLVRMTWEDWKIGFVRAAIPQIPLSILNSVIAVCKLSGDLFPDREASAMSVSVSVGVMNFVGCWFGAMPVCHGAGGLAGQYRFGGRSGASVVFLGIGKLVLALVFGNSFVSILNQFPIGILGVLLLFAGIELAMASRDMNTKEESFVMLVCAAVSLTGSSAALGFGCGILLFLLLKLRQLDLECSGFGFLKFKGKSTMDEDDGSVP